MSFKVSATIFPIVLSSWISSLVSIVIFAHFFAKIGAIFIIAQNEISVKSITSPKGCLTYQTPKDKKLQDPILKRLFAQTDAMSDKLISIKKICLSLNTLTFASTQILLFTLFPLLAEKLSLSLSTIVACFSLGTFLFLWGSPFWSSKSDKIGRDQVMSYGLAGLGISFAIIVALSTLKII